MSQQQPTENQSQQSRPAISFREDIFTNSQTTKSPENASTRPTLLSIPPRQAMPRRPSIVSGSDTKTVTISKATADSIKFHPELTEDPQNWESTAEGYVYTGTRDIDPNRPWHQPNE
ncbi:hypothetical protein L202_05592 [Cryptococcus amylolentus CBS 6039]|uniref:Uncharacterized protein n=2 Tax=Cryptococcus amylolentus TaxID=104669 RepID=A0A1E3HL22_9TREE|nr:hypothetical protein L202_05592 [Cryptococcus amylolentus CBS 6039]ODN77052.1 hypothetical protein L202_05592 [Cryptococcus amylolentus CBS 6039]ODO04910.1 hypothetical protein I350_05520 [Cryptococcus amylolentus CBS 6273]